MHRLWCRGGLAVALVLGLAASGLAESFVVVGADAGGGPHVVIRADFDNNGTYETQTDSFYAFSPTVPTEPYFAGGVRVAMGDLDGDGNDELITSMGPGGTLVRIWRLTAGGRVAGLLEQFAPYGGFAGGIFVATGDFDGDGRDEVVTGPDTGGGPHVIVYRDLDRDGRVADDPPLASFLAYVPGFSGGVRVAAGDVNNALGDELVLAPGPGGGPHVRVLTFNGASFVSLDEFLAFPAFFSGGLYVAVGPIENAGGNGAEVIVAPGAGGGPHVRIFTDTNSNGRVSDELTFDEFFAYLPSFTGGVRVAAGDTDNSAFFVEVLTAPGIGGGPHVRIFDDNPDAGSLISDNPTDDEWFAYDPAFTGGVFMAVGHVRRSAWAIPTGPFAIPEFGGGPLQLIMCVPPGSGVIGDLDVGLVISHTFVGDLDVTLTHLASGISLTLFTDIGGTDEGLIIRLNDEAGVDIGTANNPTDGAISGTFNPEGAALLSVFDGLEASGCWRLTVDDDNAAGADVGTLFEWVLRFTH